MELKKVEKKVENKVPLKVEDKKLSKDELKSTIGGGACIWWGKDGGDDAFIWFGGNG